MGLDGSIRKRPESSTTDVKYWRKNWVMQNWMDTNNCEDRVVYLETMQQLIEFIQDKDNHDYPGSEEWTQEHWDDFEEDIQDIIADMESNETYIYTYDGWW